MINMGWKDQMECKACGYIWTTRKEYSDPAFCPKCRSSQLLNNSEEDRQELEKFEKNQLKKGLIKFENKWFSKEELQPQIITKSIFFGITVTLIFTIILYATGWFFALLSYLIFHFDFVDFLYNWTTFFIILLTVGVIGFLGEYEKLKQQYL